MTIAYRKCPECLHYAEVRMPVLAGAMARRSVETGETAVQIVDRFMAGVHARHLSGLPILPTETENVA